MIDFSALWQREWQIKQQNKVQWLYPLVLFLIIITLFPLAMGTEPKLLQQLGVPAVWIAALLSLRPRRSVTVARLLSLGCCHWASIAG